MVSILILVYSSNTTRKTSPVYSTKSTPDVNFDYPVQDWNSNLTHSLNISKDNLNITDLVSNTTVQVKTDKKQTNLISIHMTDFQIYVKDSKGHCYEIINVLENNPEICQLNISSIKSVSCGAAHTLLLDEDGVVYSFGDGSRGQLGNGTTETSTNPDKIPALMGIDIKAISAGSWHSAVITSTDDLYTWGWNDKGQLGFPSKKNKHNHKEEEVVNILCTPHWLDIPEEEYINNICCGSQHTIALTGSGRIYGWGLNKYGQLGFNAESDFVDKPTELIFFREEELKIINIFARHWTTIILTE
ncbi:DgyrCDS7799 [Dimorphilus gyrociliatus]|uniref:DgyrCDS7799 n=1 Tax=Dimorphilus gyrociliatus TaxID=2664684 RepID=A0A7I8VS92_9ANNE|nr:DgyrCDS7799 [Dimorphilus gyrociliatus]